MLKTWTAATLLWLLASSVYAFPDNGVLETFTAADNTTPPNSNWTNAVIVGATSSNLRVRSNAAATVSTGIDGEAYWNPTIFNANQEAYATIVDVASTTFGQLYLRLTDIGANTTEGYRLEWADGTSAITIARIDNGATTQLGAAITQTITTTDKVGFSAIRNQLCAWFSDSGGPWVQIGCRTDNTHLGAGRIAIGVTGTNTVGGMDDFGGGNIGASGGYPMSSQ